jgi:hypothetical protein
MTDDLNGGTEGQLLRNSSHNWSPVRIVRAAGLYKRRSIKKKKNYIAKL